MQECLQQQSLIAAIIKFLVSKESFVTSGSNYKITNRIPALGTTSMFHQDILGSKPNLRSEGDPNSDVQFRDPLGVCTYAVQDKFKQGSKSTISTRAH